MVFLVQDSFALVGLAAAAGGFLTIIQTFTAGPLRVKAGIVAPQSYATEEQARTNPWAAKFNRAQRVQENTACHLPAFYGLILAEGLVRPKTAGILGLAWVALRLGYTYAYVANPKTRGIFFFPATIVLLTLSVYAAKDFLPLALDVL